MYSLVLDNSDTAEQVGVGNTCWRQTVNTNTVTVPRERPFKPAILQRKRLIAPKPQSASEPSVVLSPSRYRSIRGVSSDRQVRGLLSASRRCWVPDCPNKSVKRGDKTKLFGFPRDSKRCREWLEAIGDRSLACTTWLQLTTLRHICADHFEPASITLSGRLAHNATPTIFKKKCPVLPKKCFRIFEESIPKTRVVPDEDLIISDHDYFGIADKKGNPVVIQEDSPNQQITQSVNEELSHQCKYATCESLSAALSSSEKVLAIHRNQGDPQESNESSSNELLSGGEEEDSQESQSIVVSTSATSDHTYVGESSLNSLKKQGYPVSKQDDLSKQPDIEIMEEESSLQHDSVEKSHASPISNEQSIYKTQNTSLPPNIVKYLPFKIYQHGSGRLIAVNKTSANSTTQDTPLPVNIAKYLPLKIHQPVSDSAMPGSKVPPISTTQDTPLPPNIAKCLELKTPELISASVISGSEVSPSSTIQNKPLPSNVVKYLQLKTPELVSASTILGSKLSPTSTIQNKPLPSNIVKYLPLKTPLLVSDSAMSGSKVSPTSTIQNKPLPSNIVKYLPLKTTQLISNSAISGSNVSSMSTIQDKPLLSNIVNYLPLKTHQQVSDSTLPGSKVLPTRIIPLPSNIAKYLPLEIYQHINEPVMPVNKIAPNDTTQDSSSPANIAKCPPLMTQPHVSVNKKPTRKRPASKKPSNTPLVSSIAEYFSLKDSPKKTRYYHTLENIKNELCRLCGQKRSVLIPIFDSTSSALNMGMSLSAKIELYLHLKVKVEDPLPNKICDQCNEKLNHWHDLYLTCVAADAVLWKTFGGEHDIPSGKVPDGTGSRDQEKIIQTMVSILSPIDSEETALLPSQKEFHGLSIGNKKKEEQEEICAVCGMNTILKTSKEDDSFKEEFDNFFAKIPCMAYRCLYCCEYFKNKHERKQHVANHCGNLPLVCELCGKICLRKNHKYHLQKLHDPNRIIKIKNKKPFTKTCDVCSKCFKTAYKYNWHMKSCHQSPKYFCEFCCITFVNEDVYKKHKMDHESGKTKSVIQIKELLQPESSIVYSCPVCEEICYDKLSLVVHLTTKKIIKCSLCYKKMSNEKRFLLHKCNSWTCQYCSENFLNRHKWIVHERRHTGERPFKCRICEKSFRTTIGRKRHEETHNSTIYECRYCGKKFKTKYIHQEHVKCHEGQDFICNVCDKKFWARKSLRRHILTSHNCKELIL